MSVPDFIIGDRRDLLGGRLLPLLNAARLAEATGAKFLNVWFTDDTDYQAMVWPPTDLFTGDLVTPAEQGGALLHQDDPLLAEATSRIALLDPPAELRDAPDAHSMFGAPVYEARAFLIDHRFTLLRARADEDYEAARRGSADLFRRLPKTDAVGQALDRIDAFFAACGQGIVALHGRRMHLNHNSEFQLNRIQGWLDTSYYVALANDLDADTLYVSSDCPEFIDNLRAGTRARVIVFDDVLPGAARLSHLQRALVELYALGRAGDLYGPSSAYANVAAMIGGARFRDVMSAVAERDLPGDDRTWSVAFRRARRDDASWRAFGRRLLAGPAPTGAYLNCFWALDEDLPARAEFNLLGLAVRLTALAARNPAVKEWRQNLGRATEDAETQGHAAVVRTLRALDPWDPAALARIGTPATRAELLALLCAWTLASDHAADKGDTDTAIGLARTAIDLAGRLDLKATGLRLRLGEMLRTASEHASALAVLETAAAGAPDDTDAWLRLSALRGEMGQWLPALHAARQARDLEPDHPGGWMALAYAARALGGEAIMRDALRHAANCQPAEPALAREIAAFDAPPVSA